MTAVLARPPRDVVVVSGGDAFSFLQSLVSQDLDQVGDGQGGHTLLLTPQGKLDVDFVLLRVGDEAWLVCEGGFGSQLAASLNRFKIRVKVDVGERADLDVLVVRGADDALTAAQAAGLDIPEALFSHTAHGAARAVRVPWPDGFGVDVVGHADAVATAETELRAAGLELVDAERYDALRIAAGVPRQGVDLDEKTIPQEAFLELDAVSFTKGCFLGQELVCRIDTRGHVNRYLRAVRDIDRGAPPIGSEIIVDDKVVGAITSAGELDGGAPVALAYVRREVEPPGEVIVRWDGGESKARIEVLPS